MEFEKTAYNDHMNYFKKPLSIINRIPPHFRQFIKFCVVGTISMFVDIGLYTLCTRLFGLHYLLANLISFIVALANSYMLNRKFTFGSTHKKVGVQFTKYLTVYMVGLGLSETFLFVFINKFGIYDLIAKPLVIGIVLIWNFIGSKFFIFDRDAKKDQAAS